MQKRERKNSEALAERPAHSALTKIHVFVSFDLEHDGELFGQLLLQSESPSSNFAVLGSSESVPNASVSSQRARCRIREADQVVIICGEHTHASVRMSAELRIAQEEQIPYFLLWGRREIMCTRPAGAKPADAMYSWTQQILLDRLSLPLRKARSAAAAEALRTAPAAHDPRARWVSRRSP